MKRPFQKPYPLEHSGTSQSERQAPALPPHKLAIDGRDRDQLIAFGRRLAAHIRFATPFGNEGNWSPLFELLKNPDSFAEQHDAPPQAALFLAFIKLFEKAQGELNRLSKSHLDYYYRELLQLAPKPAQADHVNLLFEARPKRDQVSVAAGTVFTAGDLRYATDRNVWINRTTIEHLCSLYREPASGQLHFALQSNSLDGLGAALPKEQPTWPAFGHTGIPKATVGFALASPLLQLSSGKRTITASLRLELGDEDPPLSEAAKSLLIEFSGEKGWLGPFSPQSVEITESSDNWLLQFVVVLDAETEAVTAYDSELLDGGFVTTLPLMKVSVSPETPSLREWLEEHNLIDMQLQTKVENAGELVAENDLGRLDTGKPFLPFGPQPKTGSTFAVASPEMLNKQVTSFSLNLNWKGVPAKRLSDHYSTYRFNSSGQPCGTSDCIRRINNNDDFSAQMILEREDSSRIERKVKLFDNSDATRPQTLNSDEPPARLFPLTGLTYFYMPLQTRSSFSPLPWAGFNMTSSFSLLPLSLIARKAATPFIKALQGVNRPGYIKLRLDRDFLHQDYPIVLAKSMAQDSGMAIPNPPYTPELESVQLTYEAQTGWVDPTDENATAYIGAEIRLYQTTPFGQREVHGFLKSQLDASINDKIRLLPDSSPEGQLFIGLKEQPDAAFLDLLIQVDEGSANPLKEIEYVTWSLLEADHWRDLTAEEILFDESNGLLTSGILRVNIPARPPQTNTWMPEGLTWLRARVEDNSDAVCHLIDLHPQAASAHLLDAEKNPPHLTSSLPPKSIGKPVKPLDGIKGANQPYASICGQAKESDQTFYTRVSERLRHKQRAVTLWDYERLVLQAFPELFRVKCLPHLPGPGHVSLVVIPDIRQRKAYDPLQPRIDKDTESRIDQLLAALNSPFASAKVFNPDYEKIRLDIAVAFKPEYPFGAASQALQKALQKHLAPWTGDETRMPAFGGHIHKSMLLAFIMDQPSIDYVQQLKLYHLTTEETPEVDRDEVVSQNPKAILTSHHQHTIRDAASGGKRMKESLTIRRDPSRAEALDYAQLRQSGLEHIEALSHDLWTDYNAHDPGFTILELLCYAITDLSYRTRLPMADLLAVPADADAETQRRHQALQQHSTLLSALEILPTEPVSATDLRKLIIDQVPMVRNVWIEQDNSVNYFVDCSKGTQSTIAPPEDHNQTEYRLNGLYRLRVEPHDRITKKLTKQVTTDVAKVFHQHRNLCEDLAGIDLIREQAIRVCADIELTEEADIDLTCARIIHAMQQRLSPPVPRYTLQQLLKKGLAPDEIYSGPQLDHGFLLDDDLQQAELPTQVNAADLIDAIVKTAGVTAVRKLVLQSGAATKPSGDPWNIELESNRRPVFDIEQSALHFFKDLLPYRVDPDEVAKALLQLQQEARQQRATTSDLPTPDSRSVAVESYLSIQHELPPAYGVEPTGLPSHATKTRQSQARQLQGFLLHFDQLLANYLTQLRQIGSLFSADPALRHTYFSQVVPGVGEVSELVDPKSHGDYATLLEALDRQSEPDSRRRNQFLDHLLARFGERFTEYALQMQRLRLENNGLRLIQEKARFLQEYALLSRRRGSAFDITDRDQIWGSCTNIPGIQHRVGRLLGFRSIRRRNLSLLDTDLYEQIDQDSDNDFRFRIKDNLSNKILLSSSTKYKTLEDAVRELRIALDFGRFEASYQPETAKNGRHYFNLVDDKQEIIARRIEYFDTTESRDAALAGTREAINRVYDAEGMHVVENLLLRPRKFRTPADSALVGDNFISVCPDSDCGTAGEPIDPYSCQVQILVPAYAPRMHDINFRHFVERTIRMEMPAHILPRICFVDAEQMANFEEHYRAWLDYRARHPAGEVKSSRHLNRLIAVLQQIHSVYPTGELHDCQEDEGERPILLNRTHLGNEPGN